MPSLRERKRQQTMRAITEEAVKLSLERGVENITVEDICQAANISKRTFFNYVDSKEAAIYGSPPTMVTEEEIEEFAAEKRDNLLHAALELFFAHVNDDGATQEVIKLRKTLMQKHNNNGYSFGAGFFGLIHSITDALTKYFEVWPEQRQFPDEARATASLAFTAVQLGFSRWLCSENVTPQSCIKYAEDALTDLRRVIED
ncbi:MAG: TetR/AcrR family transcriptional regulator [Corynebacterium sp.]|nr:TetR/AcrR family transcriptional regulator [Corynebacterium sp.]